MSHAHTLGRLRHKRGSPGSGGRNAMSYHPLLLSDLEANQQFRANLGSSGMGKNGIANGSKVQHHTVYLHGKTLCILGGLCWIFLFKKLIQILAWAK